VTCFIYLLCIWTIQKITHRKVDHHCAVPLLRRLTSSVSCEQSFIVFHEWLGSCIAVAEYAQHNPVPRVQLGLAEIPGSHCCIAVSTFFGVHLPYIFVCLLHYYMFQPTCVASTFSLQNPCKEMWLGMWPVQFQQWMFCCETKLLFQFGMIIIYSII
jgi:hypothetical protein